MIPRFLRAERLPPRQALALFLAAALAGALLTIAVRGALHTRAVAAAAGAAPSGR